MPSFSIDIDYIAGTKYYQNQHLQINSMLITLNVNTVNPLLDEFDVKMNVKKFVGTERDIVKILFLIIIIAIIIIIIIIIISRINLSVKVSKFKVRWFL